LVKVQGRDLTPAELERQNEREMAFRQRVTRVDFKRKARRREALATPELIDRFNFKVTGRESVEGRPTLVLTFHPKGNPEKTIEDKVLNHLTGVLWVDEQEAELAKLDAVVRGPVSVGWFGAVGSLHRLAAKLERSRMPDGVWVNRSSSFSVAARKLFSAIRTQTSEHSSGFRNGLAESTRSSADGPQLHGPSRNSVASDTNLTTAWPKEGPGILWKTKVGEGWSGPVVASNRVVLFHRLDEKEVVDCLQATNGVRLWRAEYPATYRDDFGFDEGPRATPAIDGDRVFTFGANGVLNCWNLTAGTNVWRVDVRDRFKADKGFFGIACSPLVEGNAVILNIGGRAGAGIVAFDKASGKTLWTATNEYASYSSAVAATLGGKRRILLLARGALVALNANDGKVLWEFPWKPKVSASVSAATPLVINDQIFISASYNAGAAVLRFSEDKPAVVWSGDEILSNHYATSAHHGGFLYGFDGRQEERPHLRCVELKTGKVRWSEEHFGGGTLVIAGDKLLLLTDRGELILAPATPEKFAPLARAQILGVDCRAHPALAEGRFYARDKNTLVCVELRKPDR
jgi:outer membrane protein assembly factor BamB